MIKAPQKLCGTEHFPHFRLVQFYRAPIRSHIPDAVPHIHRVLKEAIRKFLDAFPMVSCAVRMCHLSELFSGWSETVIGISKPTCPSAGQVPKTCPRSSKIGAPSHRHFPQRSTSSLTNVGPPLRPFLCLIFPHSCSVLFCTFGLGAEVLNQATLPIIPRASSIALILPLSLICYFLRNLVCLSEISE
jgi:hypothetical protein